MVTIGPCVALYLGRGWTTLAQLVPFNQEALDSNSTGGHACSFIFLSVQKQNLNLTGMQLQRFLEFLLSCAAIGITSLIFFTKLAKWIQIDPWDEHFKQARYVLSGPDLLPRVQHLLGGPRDAPVRLQHRGHQRSGIGEWHHFVSAPFPMKKWWFLPSE